jgi:hypothetical protein
MPKEAKKLKKGYEYILPKRLAYWQTQGYAFAMAQKCCILQGRFGKGNTLYKYKTMLTIINPLFTDAPVASIRPIDVLIL